MPRTPSGHVLVVPSGIRVLSRLCSGQVAPLGLMAAPLPRLSAGPAALRPWALNRSLLLLVLLLQLNSGEAAPP